MSEELRIEKLYNLSETIAAELFEGLDYPWQALPLIGEFIKKLGRTLDKSEYDETAENVWIAKSAVVAPTAYINGPCIIGKNVTIGHGTIIHGCSISDNVLVGMGSIILNNAKIGKNTIIGAGSLVTQGKEFPEGVLILGNPAKVIRQLTEAEIESIQRSADNYVSLSKKYKK